MKRILLFFLINMSIVISISIITSLVGVNRWITEYGIDYNALLIFCLIWGMVGAFISLMISKYMAKMFYSINIIKPDDSKNSKEIWILNTVYNLSKAAGLSKMPEVGIYQNDEINAFATGPSRNNSLVAVSSGLLNAMDNDSVEGVIAHEVSHIANGDMVTMTLIQGVINSFVMFFARIVGFFVAQFFKGEDEKESIMSSMIYFVTVIVMEILFATIGLIIISYFSRIREYKADSGGARLAGRHKMISALSSLKSYLNHNNTQVTNDLQSKDSFASFKISGKKRSSILSLFATHPPLEDRIARLKQDF